MHRRRLRLVPLERRAIRMLSQCTRERTRSSEYTQHSHGDKTAEEPGEQVRHQFGSGKEGDQLLREKGID
jgi:hypothetical protein